MAAGKYEIVVQSPMGAQPSTLELNADGSGTQSAQGRSQPITDGKIDGNNVSWKNSITTLPDDAGIRGRGRWRQDFRQREGGLVRLVPVLGQARVTAFRISV
jgi:hypothetical protein